MSCLKENELRQTIFMELFYEEAKKENQDYILDQMTSEEEELINNMQKHINECDKCRELYNNVKCEIKQDMDMLSGGCTCCDGCLGCK